MTDDYGSNDYYARHNNLRPKSATPLTTTQATPPVNLDAWNHALLGQKQLDTVTKLSEWVKKSSSLQTAANVPPAADNDSRQQETESQAQTELKPSNRSSSLPAAPITSSSDLLPWLESVKAASASSQSSSSSRLTSPLETHLESLSAIQASTNQITALLDQLEQARVNVAELKAGAKLVEETSEELRNESERRGGSQHALLSLVDSLETYLGYYNLLPRATSFLSGPNLSLVLTPTFSLTMNQLDIGLTFILDHPHFVDAPLYRLRFQHCIMRGGNLAKLWVASKLKDLKADSLDKLKSRPKPDGTHEDKGDLHDFSSPELLRIVYSRFVAAAPELQSVLIEVHKHCPPHTPSSRTASRDIKAPPQDEDSLLADYSMEVAPSPEAAQEPESKVNTFPEFATLLTDCRNAYFDARRAIMSPLLSTVLTKIENQAQAEASPHSTSALQTFARRVLVLLQSVLVSEATLYQAIFGGVSGTTDPSSRDALLDLLRSFSKDLIDRLHPRIFAESRLSSLSALGRVILDAANLKSASHGFRRFPNHSTDAYLLLSIPDPHYPEAKEHFVDGAFQHALCVLQPLILPLMQDVLTRMTFRAHAVISGPDVAGYTPRPGSSSSSKAGSDEPMAVVRTVMSKASSKGARRKSLRGRSSLGVGVLEAAAQRAIAESEAEDHKEGAMQDVDEGDQHTIQLFSLPAQETLQTWYTPIVRVFKILAALHPVLDRSVFAQIGAESVDKTRAVIKRATEHLRSHVSASKGKLRPPPTSSEDDQVYEADEMDVTLFALHHTLLLREISASVDLSLMQLSTLDMIHESIKSCKEEGGSNGDAAAAASTSLQTSSSTTAAATAAPLGSSPSLLDLGAIVRIVGGLLDGMGIVGGGQSASASGSNDATSGSPSSPITQDLQSLTKSLVDVFVASHLPKSQQQQGGTGQQAFIEECVVAIRSFRRRVALWLQDEEIVQGIVTGVVAAVGGGGDDEEMKDVQAEILDRLGLSGSGDSHDASGERE